MNQALTGVAMCADPPELASLLREFRSHPDLIWDKQGIKDTPRGKRVLARSRPDSYNADNYLVPVAWMATETTSEGYTTVVTQYVGVFQSPHIAVTGRYGEAPYPSAVHEFSLARAMADRIGLDRRGERDVRRFLANQDQWLAAKSAAESARMESPPPARNIIACDEFLKRHQAALSAEQAAESAMINSMPYHRFWLSCQPWGDNSYREM